MIFESYANYYFPFYIGSNCKKFTSYWEMDNCRSNKGDYVDTDMRAIKVVSLRMYVTIPAMRSCC